MPVTRERGTTLLDRHLLRQLRELPVLALAWLLAWPIARLWRRDRKLIAVIGRDDGRFSDNAKYFFIHGCRRERYTVVFVTGDPRTRDALRLQGVHAVIYPSLEAVRVLLAAGTVVADSAEWVRGGRFQWLTGAQRWQLWHGVPLKGIELAVLEERLARMPVVARFLYRAYLLFYARHPRYDLVVSTSRFFSGAAFSRSFRSRTVVETGYPRNDVLLAAGGAADGLVSVNTDAAALARLRQLRRAGCRVVLYAPTFRTHGRNPVDTLDLAALQIFAERNRLCLVLKLHPVLAGGRTAADLPNVINYDPAADVYPALAEADLLVTDYSSIYFDFLLLDRPIVFFASDLDAYLRRERHLLFDYRDMTPGPIARTSAELEQAILSALADGSAFAAERARVRALAFDHPAGGAAARLWSILESSA